VKLGEAIYSSLKADTTGVYARVATRIYPLMAPQTAAAPFLTYQQISSPGYRASVADANIRSDRLQIDCYSTSLSTVRALADDVRYRLRDHMGTFPSSSGIAVQRIFFDNETEMIEHDEDMSVPHYRVSQDYIFWWSS